MMVTERCPPTVLKYLAFGISTLIVASGPSTSAVVAKTSPIAPVDLTTAAESCACASSLTLVFRMPSRGFSMASMVASRYAVVFTRLYGASPAFLMSPLAARTRSKMPATSCPSLTKSMVSPMGARFSARCTKAAAMACTWLGVVLLPSSRLSSGRLAGASRASSRSSASRASSRLASSSAPPRASESKASTMSPKTLIRSNR
mmetsp:Transcript_57925/g.102906  ORF Transcript_57925/g.102906 Transcript_57925/m.102906 type:complete len:203 (+) Transcript_57925:3774-4382(+)